MESIDLRSLNLAIEESRDIINFIAQKRGISTEKLQNMAKTQQNMVKTQQNMAKLDLT